jgi:hypothetical protein
MDEPTTRLLHDRLAELQARLDILRAAGSEVIKAWDQMSHRMRHGCSIAFHGAMQGLIVAIEERGM